MSRQCESRGSSLAPQDLWPVAQDGVRQLLGPPGPPAQALAVHRVSGAYVAAAGGQALEALALLPQGFDDLQHVPVGDLLVHRLTANLRPRSARRTPNW